MWIIIISQANVTYVVYSLGNNWVDVMLDFEMSTCSAFIA